MLNGPAIFIDDEYLDPDKAAFELRQELEADGRPVKVYDQLPDKSDLIHWQSVAFIVMDWDLSSGSMLGLGGSMLEDFGHVEFYDFLEEVLQQIFCPVFIVSAQDGEDIRRQLTGTGRFGAEELDTRLAVLAKSDVVHGFVEALGDWVNSNVALSVLYTWETEYDKAKNRLFSDFNTLDRDWAKYIYDAADEDGVEASYELASAITSNLLHRINPLEFDRDLITAAQAAPTGRARRAVSYGRTTLPGSRLHDGVVLPGDFFWNDDDVEWGFVEQNDGDGIVGLRKSQSVQWYSEIVRDGGQAAVQSPKLWLNVTPSCRTVLKREEAAGRDPGSVRLHVVPGMPMNLPSPLSKNAFKELVKKDDSPNQALVHTLVGNVPYLFDFRGASIRSWRELEGLRAGRLLPPFITRVQQGFSAFLQAEGVPRATQGLYE